MSQDPHNAQRLAELARQTAHTAYEDLQMAREDSRRTSRRHLTLAHAGADVASALALAAQAAQAAQPRLDRDAYTDAVAQGVHRGKARVYQGVAEDLRNLLEDADGDPTAEERLEALASELEIEAERLVDELVDEGHLAQGSAP